MSSMTQRTKPRILCIDDDPAITTTLGLRLGQYGIDVLTAYFGTQGIWLATTEYPDLIITDMQMPSGGGEYVVECLKRRSDTHDIPVIVLTGRRDPALQHSMLTLGVAHYFQKPLRHDRLVAKLSDYIQLNEPDG